ncbi:MAG: hypothetical protein AAF383_27205 [Cyanobacteria bacterium P01_A01_bin.83]
MSDLQVQDLRKPKTFNSLTAQETSLVVGGSTVTINNSFKDIVYAGAGNDTVLTGPGNDTIVGGLGNDSLFGGSGDDVLIGD